MLKLSEIKILLICFNIITGNPAESFSFCFAVQPVILYQQYFQNIPRFCIQFCGIIVCCEFSVFKVIFMYICLVSFDFTTVPCKKNVALLFYQNAASFFE